MSILEILQNAQYNLNFNGEIGAMLAREQLDNAIKQLEDGKGIYDKYEEVEQ